jgi:electron transfer flavoprotein beta subunit
VNSIVCIKRVPDSGARIQVGADSKSIDPAGVKYVMNPYDEYALEQALSLKEEAGEGTVTVISLGPEEARDTLRSALAMGADEAILLIAEPPADGLVVARALADAIRGREYDLVLFGKQGIDSDNMQVPAMVAEMLGHPCATVVTGLELSGGTGTARREVEGGHEVVEFDLPVVIAAQKGLNKPRHPSVKGIMMAKKKPLEETAVDLGAPGLEMIELSPPPARPEPQIVGEGADAVPELVRLLRDEAKVL